MAWADFTLAGLRARVKFRLQNDPRYTDAMVNLALKKAVVRLLLFIRNTTTIWQADTFVLTEGTDAGLYAMEYPLPDGTLWVDSLTFDGERPLKLLTEIELANTGIQTASALGDPSGFYVYDTPERIKVAVIYPRPARTATLEFYGGVEPDWQADGDASIPPFREEYSDALEAYAQIYLIEGQEGQEPKVLALEQKWKEERAEAKLNQRVNRIGKTRRTRDMT